MTSKPQPTQTVDADGVMRTLRPRPRAGRVVLIAGVALALLFVVLAWVEGGEGAPEEPGADEGGPETVVSAPAVPRAQGRLPVQVGGGAGPEQSAVEMDAPADTPPGARSGIALFPAPGTKPIKRGLVVPEGFELPPGYVRHYQTLDDGTALPAVLTFHPDYQPVDATGRPVEVAPDRLVPEALAPPGMPLQRLVLPGEEPTDAQR